MKSFYSFIGGHHGAWQVSQMSALAGEPLPQVAAITMLNQPSSDVQDRGQWLLEGFTSNIRYAERSELSALRAKQQGLGRAGVKCAALIPIQKNPAWWELSQEERRAIFEEQSHHTAIGMDYLPQIARQLHHSRDLGGPFDFITWFEFEPEHTTIFNEMLERLRASKEWSYVAREVDIRLVKN